MRTIFKTRYEQDLALARHGGDFVWYGLLVVAMVLVPVLLGEFYVKELTGLLLFSIAGVGLMLLIGYTGLVSLGHAAFMGIGAYANAALLARGVPFVISLPAAVAITAAAGAGIGIPTLRMSGLYLAIATLAFGGIVENVFSKWDSVTGGFDGLSVKAPDLFGWKIQGVDGVYYLSLIALIFVLWVCANILRSPLGRALVAIRDSEISAQSMGINLSRYKTIAFAISAGITGLAGALYGHYSRHLAPDGFNILFSIQLVTIVFVGGLGSLHGAIFGAIFVSSLPQAIAIMRDYLPSKLANLPGLEPSLFGLILVLCILFQPSGIYGWWLRLKTYFINFPLQRKASARRQKSYAKSERLR